LEHGESQLDFDVPIFDDYFPVPKLNENIELSLIGRMQYDISDLDEHVLINGNLKYAGHHNFIHHYEQITENEQLVTVQRIRNIELSKEMIWPQPYQKLIFSP